MDRDKDPPASAQPQPSALEWEFIRPIFEDLYVTQNLSLARVREQLKADHGFYATQVVTLILVY